MSGGDYLPADDRQASLHANRKLVEHVALFRQACDDNGLETFLSDRLTERFFEHLMLMSAASVQSDAMQQAMDGLGETLRRLSGEDPEA